MAGSGVREPIVVTHQGGKKFSAQVRSHSIITDQPERFGGENAGVSPLELLDVSLGSCVALYIQQFCESRDIATEGLRVEVSHTGASNPGRIGAFAVRVVLPGEIPERYSEMLERVAASCPAHHTLAMGAQVSFEFETASAPV